jgi:hypothetical protein
MEPLTQCSAAQSDGLPALGQLPCGRPDLMAQ